MAGRQKNYTLSIAAACAVLFGGAFAGDGNIVKAITIEAQKAPFDPNIPSTSQSIEFKKISDSVNIVNVEDALRYMPSVQIRKRFIGDRNSIMITRTSGSIASARALVYADGMLLSNFLGNSFGFPPRWGMVSPEEIERVDVLYGPFAAEYGGNSVGNTVLITTKEPKKFQANLSTQLFNENYELYGTKQSFSGSQSSASFGDKNGRLSWFASVNHMDSYGHPMGYAVLPLSKTAATAADKKIGGYYVDNDANGNARVVFGATGMDHTIQDSAKIKLSYDVAQNAKLIYTMGYWKNSSEVTADSYIKDEAGVSVYSGNVNIEGKKYTLSNTFFQPSSRKEAHVMSGLAFKTDSGGLWDMEATATHYNIAGDEQRSPTAALPLSQGGGAGQTALSDGTGWRTFDVKVDFRPQGAHKMRFGYHYDRYILDSRVYATDNWRSEGKGAFISAFGGSTATRALFFQDAYAFAQDFRAVAGGRFESWSAFDGSAAKAKTAINLPSRDEEFFSPKIALEYTGLESWLLRASFGKAVRTPTVSELFQGSINAANVIVNNDPNLKSEKALSYELSAQRDLAGGYARVSLFAEDMSDALYSQTDVTVFPNVTNIQNIDKIVTHGFEIAYEQANVLREGLDLGASLTYADSKIVKNSKFPISEGKKQPRVPLWRATATATYRQNSQLSYTLATRYSGRQYNTMDNIDSNPQTYGGTSSFLFFDAKLNYALGGGFGVSAGVDNIGNYKAYAFHPYAQRTIYAKLKYEF